MKFLKNIKDNIKDRFKKETDVEILKSKKYTNRMKYMLITLRDQEKLKYRQLITSQVHKKELYEQEVFFFKLSEKMPKKHALMEANMEKDFIADYPQYEKYVKKYCK